MARRKFFAGALSVGLRKGVRLEDELEEGDLLLVPDLFRDGRMDRLPRVIAQTAARSIAIFHDAAALRLGGISPVNRKRFHDYIEALAAFDLVICISQDSCDHLQRLWLDRGIAPAPTCVERWPVEWERPERRAIGNSSRNLIVCVGTLESRKNYPTLLRALESLWEEGLTFEFELIGRSPRNYGHKILPSIRKIQERGWPFRWLKHVDDERLDQAYRDCAFTVYPSLMEGFGLPILESLSRGKPCICGDNGALGEVSVGRGMSERRPNESGGFSRRDETIIDRSSSLRAFERGSASAQIPFMVQLHRLLGRAHGLDLE